MARPTKYKEEFADQAYRLCLLGCTNDELADFFQVDVSTVINWAEKKNDFSDAMKRGKVTADAAVAERFYNRIKGYEYDEVTYEKVDSKLSIQLMDAKEIVTEPYKVKVVTKHLPADPGAALNWLKNRQRDKWRDKQDFSLDWESLSDQQLDKIIERLTAKANTYGNES